MGFQKMEDQMTTHLNWKIVGLTQTLPNSAFRKRTTHIHDVEHLLFECYTSQKGEAFIAGWEISTGMFKHFPLGFLSLWTMGCSLWNHPKVVFNGFSMKQSCKGVIELGLRKKELLESDIKTIKSRVLFVKPKRNNVISAILFLFWIFLSQLFFISPLMLIGLMIGIVILNRCSVRIGNIKFE